MLPLALSALLALGPTAPTPPAAPRTPNDVPALVERIAELLDEHYVFPEVARACAEHLRAELAAGRLESGAPEAGFAERVTSALQSISHDRHMTVRGSDRGAPRPEVDPVAAHSARLRALRAQNFGFRRVEILDGNVGYIDLRSFSDAALAGPTLHAAMGLVAGVDALIVDLRKNGGGDPETVRQLCSYFFDAPTHINSLYFRATDTTTEFWTLADVPGAKLVDAPLFVLTSRFTFSAAEEFTYNVKTRGRAKIVGETTGGGANPGGTFPIDDDWQIFVPTGRAINPVTGTNWEGVGIAPDVEVVETEALKRALGLAQIAAQNNAAGAARAELRAALCTDAAGLAAELAGGGADVREALAELWTEGVTLGVVDPVLLRGLADGATPEHAEVLLEVATHHWPEVLDLWRELARVRRARGDEAGAKSALERVLAIDPHDTRARSDGGDGSDRTADSERGSGSPGR